jgi:hypothetical protein
MQTDYQTNVYSLRKFVHTQSVRQLSHVSLKPVLHVTPNPNPNGSTINHLVITLLQLTWFITDVT